MRIVPLILALLCCVGCAASVPFQKLPRQPEEFQVPPQVLRQQYPEITLYEHAGFFPPNTAPVEQLVALWGKPDGIESRAAQHYGGLGGILGAGVGIHLFSPAAALAGGSAALIIAPFPLEHYFWKKERYCVEAVVVRGVTHSYKKSVVRWKWHDRTAQGDSPQRCK